MNISRRGILSIAGLTISTAALSACAGTGSSSDSSKKDEGSGPLQFWSNHPGSSRDMEQQLIDAWNKENPDHKAELIDGGANYEELGQKFNAALSGGDLPDVIVASDVTWFNFAFTEATTALDDLWKENNIDTSTYVKTLLEDYKYDGKHYGVPYSRSTPLMYWYTEDLKKAGLSTDKGPATWQEFAEEWAPKIKKATGKPALAVADGTSYLDWYFQGAFWTFGGAYSDEWDLKFTDPKTVEAGKFLQKMVKEGYIKVVKDSANEFGIGNTAGLLESTGSLGGLKESAKGDFVTTYLPGPKPGTTTGGAGLAIPAGISEERKKVAVKFIDFMTNTDNTIKFTQKTGYMPVRTDASDNPEQAKYLKENPNAETAIKQLAENTKSQDYARVFVNGGGTKIGGALDKIVAGQDVEETFKALQDDLQKIIDRDIKPNL